jgi:putative aldouronate transport system permease protein
MSLPYLRKSAGEKLFIAFAYLGIGLFSLSILLPLLHIVQQTVSTVPDPSFRIIPRGFTLSHYVYVIRKGLILRPLFNSFYLTAVCTLASMAFTVLLAYPLSRTELFGRRILNFILVFPMMISLGFLPRYLLVKDLGLLNSYVAIILTSAISSYNTIIMRNYFQSIPESLVESARMDGCPEIRILVQIIFPVSMAVIATVTLFYMVSIWNSYFNIILYLTDSTKHTLQVILRVLVMEDTRDAYSADNEAARFSRNVQSTTIVIAIIPVMVVYPFLQRHFVKGIMLGSVKG